MIKDYKNVLKTEGFIALWVSQILSQFTINIINFLLLLKLFKITGSTVSTSLLWVSYAIPAIFIGPIGAVMSDMVSRKKLLIFTNLAQAFVILLYSFSNNETLFWMYGIAFIYSFLNQFYVPAEFAALPSLARKKHLAKANSLFFLTQQLAIVAGFSVAGIFNQTIGFSKSLVICSGFLFIAFLSVITLPKLGESESLPSSFSKALSKFFAIMIDGYRLIVGERRVLTPFFLLIILQISLTVIIVNIPLIATDILGVLVDQAGTLVVAPAGFGALLGALVIPKLLDKKWRKMKTVENFMFLMSISFIILVFFVSRMTQSIRLLLGVFSIVLTGFSYVGLLIPIQTFLQEQTPIKMRGRVFGSYWFIVTILSIVPVITSGAISQFMGIKPLFLIFSFSLLFGSMMFFRYGRGFIERGYRLYG